MGTLLTLTHRAIGMIPPEFHAGVNRGWEYRLGRVRELADRKQK